MGIETEYELSASKSLTLTAKTGVVQLGPVGTNERWEINRYNTFSTLSSNVDVYVNFISNSNYLDGTLTADGDTGGIQVTLRTGESLLFAYSNAVIGDTVTARIYGRRYVKGDRSYGAR